jgi:hypothetical protein
VVQHLDAGPAEVLPKDDLPPLVGELSTALVARLAADVPDVARALDVWAGRSARPTGPISRW